jgi:hypothetical protein
MVVAVESEDIIAFAEAYLPRAGFYLDPTLFFFAPEGPRTVVWYNLRQSLCVNR